MIHNENNNNNKNNQLFDDNPIEKETFTLNYNHYLNKNIISNYSFELINDKIELLNEEIDISDYSSEN